MYFTMNVVKKNLHWGPDTILISEEYGEQDEIGEICGINGTEWSW